MPTWDPDSYLRFADERGRPFADLLARVGAIGPREVVDLGCGPGNLTATLADRWPGARVTGIDSSPPMIDAARARGDSRVRFDTGDVRDWQPDEPVDVLVCNATLQWVPGHLQLLPRWLTALGPAGWLALQVPGNFDAPSHRVLAELVATEPYAAVLGASTERAAAPDPPDYLAALVAAVEGLPGELAVDVWETTYLHLLAGADPVLAWLSGTGARPAVQALAAADQRLADRFVDALAERLRAAYPPGPGGTVLPFRRVFAVAHRVDAGHRVDAA